MRSVIRYFQVFYVSSHCCIYGSTLSSLISIEIYFDQYDRASHKTLFQKLSGQISECTPSPNGYISHDFCVDIELIVYKFNSVIERYESVYETEKN